MGAGTGNKNVAADADRRQQAMEGQMMRRRSMEQQGQMPAPEPLNTPPVPQAPMGRGPQMGSLRSGIEFGPGRSSRIPEQGSPEYEQLLQRVRGMNQGNR